jgi:tetratricopeptide (TPR) repeat protein
VVTLIDAIGWSFVELGNYSEAKRCIEHGVALTEETGQVFYRAKGQRHLGVICRRTGDFQGARKFYEESMAIALTVPSDKERDELVAGLHYALASLAYFTNEHPDAMSFIQKAIASFSTLKDEYRLNMSYVLKGDIQFKLDQKDKARDTYRFVLQRADRNTEKLQVIRSMLGLAEVYLAESNWEGVQKMIQQAEDMNRDQFKAEAERLKTVKARLPNRSQLGAPS